MRYIILVVFIAVISLKVFAQDALGLMPFAYVYQNPETGQLNMTLMDALTGEALFTYNDDNYCSIGLSNDRRLFLYSHNRENNYIFDIDYGIGADWLPEGYLINFITSANGNLLALHYDEGGITTLGVYETRSERILFTAQYYFDLSHITMRFDGMDLLYAFVVLPTNTVEFHRQTAYHDEVKTFPVSADVSDLGLSPDGNFLIVVESDTMNIINLVDDSRFNIGQADNLGYLSWLPNQAATLAYMTADESGNPRLLEYDLYAQDNSPVNVSYPLFLSPNGDYAFYAISDEHDNTAYRMINMVTGEEMQLNFSFHDRLDWLSPSQFVFSDVSNNNNDNRDIYFYDINTREKRQLTNTPELDENFECKYFLG